MKKPARIIINADDFGLSSSVNEAVLHASEAGVLSSATIMVNTPGFVAAAKATSVYHRLGVGVHLNILRGKPICNPSEIRSLVGEDGRFLGTVGTLWKKFIRRSIDLDQVEKELRAQVMMAIKHGIRPTHLDSEKHLHIFFPQLWEPVCRIATEFDIPCVRVVREPIKFLGLPRRPKLKQLVKTSVINWRSSGFARVAKTWGLRFVENFFGLAMTGQMTSDVYQTLFKSLKGDSVEIMCHPADTADASSEAHESSWLDPMRVDEYRALIDPKTKEALIENDIELINYGEL